MTQLGHIHLGIAAEDYHQRELGVVSKSALDEIDRSPAHYFAWANGLEREETPALKFGKAFHCSQLEPHVFESTYRVEPDFGDCRTKDGKARRDEWRAGNAGRVLITADDMEAIIGMQRSVAAHPAASRLIQAGQSEVTLRYVDEGTGLPGKSRADYWVREKRFVVDLKSTRDASKEAFAKDVYNRRYHVQDALYRAAFAACGERIDHFAIIAVEKEPPYAVAVYTLDTDAVTKGYASARLNIETLKVCLEKNEWPSYNMGVEQLSLPAWSK